MSDLPAILALDQSLEATGFALFADGKVAMHGSWHLCDGARNRALGFRELFTRLDSLHRGRGFAQIVHEAPAFGAVNKGSDQLVGSIGLIAVIELFAESRRLPAPRAHAPISWRTSWFRKAERKAIAAKPQRLRDWKRPALERAEQYGFDVVSHDEAEAIAILHHDLIRSGIQPPWVEPSRNLEMLHERKLAF